MCQQQELSEKEANAIRRLHQIKNMGESGSRFYEYLLDLIMDTNTFSYIVERAAEERAQCKIIPFEPIDGYPGEDPEGSMRPMQSTDKDIEYPNGKESWDELTDAEKDEYIGLLEEMEGGVEFFVKRLSFQFHDLTSAAAVLKAIEKACTDEAQKTGT